MIYFVTAIG